MKRRQKMLYSRDPETNCHRLRSSEVVSRLNPPLPLPEGGEMSENTLIKYWHHGGPYVSVCLLSCFLTAVGPVSQMHTALGQKQEGSRPPGGWRESWVQEGQ